MKRLFFVILFGLISPTLWANFGLVVPGSHNLLNLSVLNQVVRSLDPKVFQSDTIRLSRYDSTNIFRFPINVSIKQQEELNFVYQAIDEVEETLKPKQIQGFTRQNKVDIMPMLRSVPNLDWHAKQFLVLINEIVYKNQNRYPVFAEFYFYQGMLPFYLYIQSVPALSFLIEQELLTLSKLYSGKNIIEWAFFLDRENMLNKMLTNYPQILKPDKLKIFLKKMLKQNQIRIVQWLLTQGVSLTKADYNKALFQAILEGKIAMAHVLLEHKPESLHQISITKLMYQLLQNYKLETAKWLHQTEIKDLKRQSLSSNNTTPSEEDIKNYFSGLKQLSIQKIDTKTLINQALSDNKMEVAQWIYKFVPDALETSSARKLIIQALNANNFEKADWILAQKSRMALPIATARELILQALTENNFEKADWIYKNKLTVFKQIDTNKLIIQALTENNLKKPLGWNKKPI